VKPVLVTRPVWNLGLYSKASGPIEKSFEVVAVPPLSSLDVELLPNPHWSPIVSVKQRPDRAEAFDFLVRSDAPKSPGILRREVVLRPTTLEGVSLPPKQITIEAEVVEHDTRLNPTELYLGGVKVGEAVESRVVVTSLSGRELRVEKVEPDGADLEVAPGDGPNEFRVKQRVTRSGQTSGMIWFTARTPDGVERVGLTVEVVGVERADR
jgi:hypothetical protein